MVNSYFLRKLARFDFTPFITRASILARQNHKVKKIVANGFISNFKTRSLQIRWQWCAECRHRKRLNGFSIDTSNAKTPHAHSSKIPI